MQYKKPQVYLQTWPTTCSTACMMMTLNYFMGTELTRAVERDLRHNLKMRGCDIIPAVSVALYMKQQGLSIEVRHDTPYRFWKLMEIMSDDFTAQMRERHRIASERGVVIKPGEIMGEEIVEKLRTGSLVILGIELTGGVKHAILLYHEAGDRIFYIDPLSGYEDELLDILLARARMDVGMWYISALR